MQDDYDVKHYKRAEDRRRKAVILSVFLAIITATVAICWYDRKGVKITMDEYGDKWPFVSKNAWLTCDRGVPLVRINGKKYALTNKAQKLGYSEVSAVWRENPKQPGSKIWLGDIISHAKKYCRH